MKFANEVKNTPDLLVAEIGVKDYGEKENEDLAQKYGVKKEDFPAVKLFLNGNLEKPIVFDDKDFKVDNLKRFITQKTNVKFLLDDCLAEFDDIAIKFAEKSTTKDQQKKLLEEAKKKEAALTKEADKKSAKVYVKLMEKAVERGNIFFESENERVKNILSGKIADAKKSELQGRLNILNSFLLANLKKDELWNYKGEFNISH